MISTDIQGPRARTRAVSQDITIFLSSEELPALGLRWISISGGKHCEAGSEGACQYKHLKPSDYHSHKPFYLIVGPSYS